MGRGASSPSASGTSLGTRGAGALPAPETAASGAGEQLRSRGGGVSNFEGSGSSLGTGVSSSFEFRGVDCSKRGSS
jgi:hypothetical protein